MEHRTRNLDEEIITAERAFEWLRRLEAAHDGDKEAFHRWLKRSPQNTGELLVATSTEIVMRDLFRAKRIDPGLFLSSAANNILEVGKGAPVQRQPASLKRVRFFAAIGLSLAAAATAFFVAPAMRTWLQPTEFSTSIGEQRAIELPDGSAISINAQSSVRFAFSADTRDVYLNRGQAMFTVAKDPDRPFRVHVAASEDQQGRSKGSVIQAIGTKFDVRRRAGRVNVAVVEGAVQIHPDGRPGSPGSKSVALAKVAAGQGVSIERTGLITVPAPINPSDVGAWQQRRLVFSDNTLQEIAEEFGRYNRIPQIRIVGDELRAQRFSGVFDADNPEGLLLFLSLDDSVVVIRAGDSVTIRSRSGMVEGRTTD